MYQIQKILAVVVLFVINDTSFSQSIEIEYHQWQYDCKFRTDSAIFVINSEKEFNSVGDCILRNYAFEKYTVIGFKGSTGGCKYPDIDFRILKNVHEKKYQLMLSINQNGACRLNWHFQNIIYTDKFDPTYKIEKLINVVVQ